MKCCYSHAGSLAHTQYKLSIHTCTNSHTETHSQYKHMSTLVQTYTHKHIHTYTHTNKHTHKHTHIKAHTLLCIPSIYQVLVIKACVFAQYCSHRTSFLHSAYASSLSRAPVSLHCVCVCVRVRLRARARARVCERACVFEYVWAACLSCQNVLIRLTADPNHGEGRQRERERAMDRGNPTGLHSTSHREREKKEG